MTTEDQKSRDEFEAWLDQPVDAYLDGVPIPRRLTMHESIRSYVDFGFMAGFMASRRTYRATVLEEAASVCEGIFDRYGDGESLPCAEAIRALIPCAGTNCGATTGPHSAECIAEHARAVAGLPKDEK